MNRSKNLLAVAAAGALLLAACGSDGGGEGATTGAPAETEAPPETGAPVETEAPGETGAPVETEASAETGAPVETEAPAETEASGDSGSEGAEYVVDVANCEDPAAATALFDGDTIKIGTSVPLSGGPAVLFAPYADGARAYIDYYNNQFGGIDGVPLELIVKDDQYTADLTVANVDELVFDDQVDIIAGIIGSPNNLAVQADLNAQCIPHLWASTGASNWGEIDTYPWSSGLLVAYDIESEVWADYATSQGAETAALFYVNNEFGQAYADAFKAAAEAAGLEIVAEETIDAADSGAPSGQMTNLVQSNADTILAVPLGAQCIAFMTELGNAKAANPDFDPLVYQTATCANALFFGAVSNGGSDGVYTSSNIKDLNDPTVRDSDENVIAYVDGLQAIGSDADPSNTAAAAGWLAMELAVNNLVEASKAGNLSREGVIDAVRNIDYQPGMVRDGCRAIMNAEDAFIGECTQVQAWDATSGGFVDQGQLYNLEGTLGVAG